MRMLETWNRIYIALSGFLSPNIALNVMSVRAVAKVLNWNDKVFGISTFLPQRPTGRR